MSRVSEAPAGDPAAKAPREPAAGKVVCPFCGQSKSSSQEPCPRCTMEDTPTTRQATKARIGPWYVLQHRSPSAPGMKYSTLLWLVNKGHVTPRSIVRGPTTHQLWRYAAHVRGLSREWRLCYSCGGSIEKGAPVCSHCERSQEPPEDPDILIEIRTADPRAAVMREVEPREARRGMRSDDADREQRVAPPRTEPVFVSAEPSHTERLRLRNQARAQQDPDAPARRAGSIVSGMDLAAALKGSGDGESRSRRVSVLNIALFLFVLVGGAAAAVLYLRPDYRAPTMAWVQGTWDTVRAKIAALRPTSPPTDRPVKVAEEPRPQRGPDVREPEKPKEQTAKKQAPAKEPEPQLARDTQAAEPPQQQSRPPVAQPAPTAAEFPKSIDRAIEEARALWVQAIDAEARKDFATAVRLYEQIKQLPQGAWPGGLQVSLDLAKRRAAGQSASQ